jgi:acyl dehydratase
MELKNDAVGLYYEDLKVGRTFATPSIEVTEAEMVSFASRYDPQPFHTSRAAGEASVFGGLAASGWLTCSLTMRLTNLGDEKLAGGMIGLGVDSMNWPRPVRAGDTLMAVAEVTEMRLSASKPNYGIVKFRTVTTNQKGESVLVMTANQLVLRRSPGTA